MVICPTITATDAHEYREQVERVAGFAEQIHIDLMDGVFAPTVSPGLDQVWWPDTLRADIHLMYQKPLAVVDQLIRLHPRLVVIHAEADDAEAALVALRRAGIKAGVALLADTDVEQIGGIIEQADHALIFSGHLGYHGGEADLGLLAKVQELKARNSAIELGWDGGITDQNTPTLIEHGIAVLNVGGFVQNSSDPAAAYATLKALTKKETDD